MRGAVHDDVGIGPTHLQGNRLELKAMKAYWRVVTRSAAWACVLMLVLVNLAMIVQGNWDLAGALYGTAVTAGAVVVSVAMAILATLALARRMVRSRLLFVLLTAGACLVGWTLIGAVGALVTSTWTWFGGYPLIGGIFGIIAALIAEGQIRKIDSDTT